MNREEFERLAASVIDGDIPEEDRTRLAEWLASHPEERKEFEEIQKTYSLLGHLDQPVKPKEPINVSGIVFADRQRRNWRRWIISAAACFLMLFVCSSQGFLIQVGDVRISLGPIPEVTTGQQEILELLAQSKRISERQAGLEDSMNQLAYFQEQNTRVNQREMERFTKELVRELNRYFKDSHSLAYLQPAVDSKTGDGGGKVN